MGLLTLLRGSVWKGSYLIFDGIFDCTERVCMGIDFLLFSHLTNFQESLNVLQVDGVRS